MRTRHSSISSITLLSALSLGLMLTACGGGGGSRVDDTVNRPGPNDTDLTQPQDIGRGSGANFVSREIAVASGEATLSAGGVTTLTVNIVNGNKELTTSSINVTFNSPCIAADEAQISAPEVTTTNGEARVTYTANGCVGADEVVATAEISGQVLSARATINVEGDTVGSVRFIDATPQIISLKGTGGTEVSVVRFRVMGSTDAPVKNSPVEFSLTPADSNGEGIGGLKLTSTTATTDSSGYVSATVQAGRVPTSIRVRALSVESGLSTLSNDLTVSTGIPDQKSMSLAVESFRPAAWNYNNVPVEITVGLADAFNNPPPNDTAVYFTTEGGIIDPNCTTDNGTCSVTWRSQEPRPLKADNDYSIDRILCRGAHAANERACIAARAGRVTILATALGNESFVDTNGNGIYDHGVDIFAKAEDDATNNPPLGGGNCFVNVPTPSATIPSGSALLACDDLPEAYLDKNESGTRNTSEEFVDISTKDRPNNATYDNADGKYNGALCVPPDGSGHTQASWEAINHCTNDLVTIRQETTIIMACHQPLIVSGTGRLPDQPSSVSVEEEGNTIVAFLADCNGNSMPDGTEVSVDSEQLEGADVSVSTTGYFPYLSGQQVLINLSASGAEEPRGFFRLIITVPTLSGDIITTTAPTFVN